MSEATELPFLSKLVSLILLAGLLITVPLLVVLLGQRTRAQIKADIACSQPQIPDPTECEGGEWRLYTNEESCVRFRCSPF